MRVIAGTARSLPLKTVDGKDTRPTTDRIKETLFNILAPYLPGCRFLDLFSGSGGIGIEALSRGAVSCVFVESGKKAAACIRDNLVFTKLDAGASLYTADVFAALPALREKGPFDVIFMDPPYGRQLEKRVLESLSSEPFHSLMGPDALIVVEADRHTDFSYVQSLGFQTVKEKNYKTNMHLFLQRA